MNGLNVEGLKEIEDIQVGDYVYAENPETGEKGLKEVLHMCTLNFFSQKVINLK